MVAELLEGWINTMTANGVCTGTQSVLVAALSHFLELKSKLELLESERNADLIEDQADALFVPSVCVFGLAGIAHSFLGCP
jgi:hypothetical protein